VRLRRRLEVSRAISGRKSLQQLFRDIIRYRQRLTDLYRQFGNTLLLTVRRLGYIKLLFR